MKTVCIVGNSRNLLSQELGNKIDSCDDVIRIQKFKREGFEKHVGSKITVASLSWKDVPQMRDFIEYGNIDINSVELWAPHKLEGERLHTAMSILGHANIFAASRETYSSVVRELYSNFWTKKPSTGIMTIVLALQKFHDRKIYICGFDSTIEKDHYYDPNHIDRLPPGMTVSGHNWEKEWEYIQKLIDLKKMYDINSKDEISEN